jgi:beta-lactamase regulating signal transducer with metallopeptidase domain
MIVELINQHADRLTQVGLHFLWQATAIAILAAIIGRFLITNPRHRATLYLGALVALFLCVPITLMNLSSPSPEQIVTPTATQPIDFEITPTITPLISNMSELPEPTKSPLTPSFWITGIYLAGLLLMLVRVARGYHWSSKIRRHGKAINDGPWCDALIQAISRMKPRSKPLMIWSEKVASPVVTGILRPMIVLPVSLMSGLPREQAIAVLSHELAHLRRFDHLIVVFQRLLEALFFFHPAIWFLSHRLDQEREKACDDLVVKAGHNRADYAEALVNLASDHQPAFALAVAQNSHLKERIFRILNHPQSATVQVNRSGWLTIAAAIFALGFVSLTPANSEEKEEEQTEETEESKEDANPIVQKLHIKIPEINFTETTVDEAVGFLRIRSVELDPERTGINLLVRRPRGVNQEPNRFMIDSLVAREFTFKEALDAICMKTQMKYQVDEFAVTLLPLVAEEDVFVQRKWTVPPDFLTLIAADGIAPDSKGVLSHLAALDIPFPKGASVSLLKVSNILIVRNTRDNLELIDKIVEASTDRKLAEVLRASAKTDETERRNLEAYNKTLVQRKWNTHPDFFERLSGAKLTRSSKSTIECLEAFDVTFFGNAAAAFLPEKNLLVVRNTPANLERVDSIVKASVDPEKLIEEKGLQEEARKANLDQLNKIIIPRIKLNEATLEEAVEFLRFRSLEVDPTNKGVSINIFGPEKYLAKSGPITLDIRVIPLPVILQYLCEATNSRYLIEGRNISILPK